MCKRMCSFSEGTWIILPFLSPYHTGMTQVGLQLEGRLRPLWMKHKDNWREMPVFSILKLCSHGVLGCLLFMNKVWY